MGKLKDIAGNKYGKLTVESFYGMDKRYSLWLCRCECGNTKVVSKNNLLNGHVKSCGCLIHTQDSPLLDNLIGNRYGNLVVVEKVLGKDKCSTWWRCKCDCGGTIDVRAQSLKRATTTSCGCRVRTANNKSNSRLYHIWKTMKSRCENPKCEAYPNYGGRGISVCCEWQKFDAFEKWSLNNGYSDNLTIDRIDTFGDYEPNNCRWTTFLVQNNNRRDNHIVEYQGKKYTLAQLSREKGINYNKLLYRLKRNWDIERALTE